MSISIQTGAHHMCVVGVEGRKGRIVYYRVTALRVQRKSARTEAFENRKIAILKKNLVACFSSDACIAGRNTTNVLSTAET